MQQGQMLVGFPMWNQGGPPGSGGATQNGPLVFTEQESWRAQEARGVILWDLYNYGSQRTRCNKHRDLDQGGTWTRHTLRTGLGVGLRSESIDVEADPCAHLYIGIRISLPPELRRQSGAPRTSQPVASILATEGGCHFKRHHCTLDHKQHYGAGRARGRRTFGRQVTTRNQVGASAAEPHIWHCHFAAISYNEPRGSTLFGMCSCDRRGSTGESDA